MMVTVTKPLEAAIKQVPDLADIRSITSRGSCEISAFMNWNANIDLSQQRIESQIAEIRNDLPPGVQITVERMNPSILPVIGYTLETNNTGFTAIDMKQISLGVPGKGGAGATGNMAPNLGKGADGLAVAAQAFP